MRAYAIRDAEIDKNRDLAYLLYYERVKEFHIEICYDVDEWDAPLLLSSYIKRGCYSVNAADSSLWVEQRIVPPDRQNLGMILRENGLSEYDPFRMLIIADGRCAQDDCFLVPLQTGKYPEILKTRISRMIEDVIFQNDSVLLFFKDGMVRRISAKEMQSKDLQKHRFLRYRKEIEKLHLAAGGCGLRIDETRECCAEELREMGEKLPLTGGDFRNYICQNVIDTAAAAEILGCSRQNIQDLVRRGRLKPVMTLKNTFLFMRNELQHGIV